MFEHEHFDKYAFKDIPLNRDIYLMDEKWMHDYEASLLSVFAGNGAEYKPVGYISYACARKVFPGVSNFHGAQTFTTAFMRSRRGCQKMGMSPARGLGSRMTTHVYSL